MCSFYDLFPFYLWYQTIPVPNYSSTKLFQYQTKFVGCSDIQFTVVSWGNIKIKNLFQDIRLSASNWQHTSLLWGALANSTEKKIEESVHVLQDEAPKMPEIYLKAFQNIFFKIKNLFENVRLSASNRWYTYLLWGALANSTEKRLKNPSMSCKIKHPRYRKYI